MRALLALAFVFVAGCTAAPTHFVDLEGQILGSDGSVSPGIHPSDELVESESLVALPDAKVTATIITVGRVRGVLNSAADLTPEARFRIHMFINPAYIESIQLAIEAPGAERLSVEVKPEGKEYRDRIAIVLHPMKEK